MGNNLAFMKVNGGCVKIMKNHAKIEFKSLEIQIQVTSQLTIELFKNKGGYDTYTCVLYGI